MRSHGPHPALLIKGMGVRSAQGPVESAFLEGKEPGFESTGWKLLFRRPSIGGCRCLINLQRGLESADSLADALGEFGNLPGSKYEQSNSKNDQQMCRLK